MFLQKKTADNCGFFEGVWVLEIETHDHGDDIAMTASWRSVLVVSCCAVFGAIIFIIAVFNCLDGVSPDGRASDEVIAFFREVEC